MKKSIVLRGRMTDKTQDAISCLRTWFDGEIVLSTWDYCDVSSICGANKIILTKDPFHDIPHKKNPLIRQLLLGKSGIDETSGELILVGRTDIAYTQDIFPLHGRLNANNGRCKIYDSRIVVPNIMTMNPDKGSPPNEFGLWLSDWFHLGSRDDICKHFNLLDVATKWGDHGCPEQLWICSALNKYAGMSVDPHKIDEVRDIHWDVIVNNFSVVNAYRTAHIVSMIAHHLNQSENHYGYLMEEDYIKVYNRMYVEDVC